MVFPCTSQGLVWTSGDCEAGYYCDSGSSTPTPSGTGGDKCTPGYYCPAASSAPQVSKLHPSG